MSEHHNQIRTLWEKIVDLLEDSTVCNSGATESQIRKLCQVIGRDIPTSYREFLTVCNGLGIEGFKQLSPTPLGTEEICRRLVDRGKLNIKYATKTVFDSNSTASQAFAEWPKELLEISSCDDMGHAIDLASGKIFFYDYIEGGHVKFQFASLEELLEKTLAKFQDGRKGFFGWTDPRD